MQSTASAAGASTGATIATAFGAYLLITGHHVSWPVALGWTVITACLGVFLAVVMKRQMINQEQLPFPSGIAAAQTLKSLYSRSVDSVNQARAMVISLAVGAVTGLLSKGEFLWQTALGLRLPELVQFNLSRIGLTSIAKAPGFGFEPSTLLISAGMITGMRVSASMFGGSLLLYLVVCPLLLHYGMIESPAHLLKWSLWSGTALLVTSGLTAVAVQWRTIARSFSVFKQSAGHDKALDAIEVPNSWFFAGVIPLTIALTWLGYVAFSISIWVGVMAVGMSFLLALVACRATGETDITPIGAMGKITQAFCAVVAPSNITTNLMAASATANIASSSADLLTDLKSGYLLGANPRKQFIAQFLGVFFGAIAVVPAWYLLVPDKAALEAFNPPSTNMWRAVAEALAHGIHYIPLSARWGMLVGGLLGVVLALCDHYFPKSKRFTPSAMGLGMAWVMPFSNCLSFFIGAVISLVWSKVHPKSADNLTLPVASGAIAGESLSCAFLSIFNAATALWR